MSYHHDVFISYRREENTWTSWVDEIFKRDLETYLQQDFGDDVDVFLDGKIPVSVNYVNHLAGALAKSKVMIALLSRAYFRSDWCVHELDLMIGREGIVFPIVVHDGDYIPDDVAQLQSADFAKYAFPALRGDGPLYAEFWKSLKPVAQQIALAIDTAPAFEMQWENNFQERFKDVYAASRESRRVPPTNFTLKADSQQKTPPRLRT